MNKKIPHIIMLATIAGLLAISGNSVQAQTTDSLLANPVDQSMFPQITVQPVDQTVLIGADVVLSVQASNADGYQWLCNGIPLDEQTNNVLIIQNAGIDDVGLYSCEVFNGDEMVPTRTASVCVETTAAATTTGTLTTKAKGSGALTASAATVSVTRAGMPGGGPIIVFGAPYAGSGSQGTCPGTYVGYVSYSKTISQGWGWTLVTGATVLTATDTNRPDTKVQYFGLYGDSGCAQNKVTIPYPPFSPAYRFTIYFTNNIPTNAYPIVLTGFNP
jgi:hypothetical protein